MSAGRSVPEQIYGKPKKDLTEGSKICVKGFEE